MPRCRPAPSQQRLQLGLGQLRGRARGWGGGQDSAGVGAEQPVALVGEGRDDSRVALPQLRTQLVVRAGAVPDGVLLRAGKHGDGLGEFGIGWQ
jgi:hypothetical protein